MALWVDAVVTTESEAQREMPAAHCARRARLKRDGAAAPLLPSGVVAGGVVAEARSLSKSSSVWPCEGPVCTQRRVAQAGQLAAC